ncbi:hypothetical protein BpHYR1_002456 [Brachionus plicatilis]|uniref:Uncharacterized protein n=1 Tax=Brachionus plicatilis TaxID=10195 RepID=A0A3M7SBD1_BRAPC|nr:hypothetical protein BpHYR1_002456 [Brachionus plicatilis]
METQIKIKEDTLKRWRSRGLSYGTCAQKEQFQSVNQGVEQLEEENAELRGRVEQDEPLKYPVSLVVYTSERRIVALFCSHMLCSLCHQRLIELD